MNRIKRLGITLLMVLTILIQAVITYGIPNEVVGKTYIEIPVKFKGDITSMISAYVRKAQTTGNANELFDISGYVIFDIKAYAYETGSEVKVGAEITYKDKDGNTQKDWWDNVEQLNKSAIGWPSCSGYFITVQDNIRFVEPYQNKTELRIMLEMKGKNSGFSRATNHGVSLSQNAPDPVSADEYPKVQLQTINRHNQTVNNYSVVFDVNGTQQKEIFPSPLSLEPGAKVAVTIAGKKLDKQQYQVIASQPEPVIPAKDNSGWKSLGDIPKVLPNTKEAYPDLIDRAGYISTRHYNYKYNSTQYGSGSIPPRAETFDYPIGKNLVIQKSNLDSQKQYHSIEEKSAFFDKSNIGKTVMDAVYIPTESGQYQFGVYSNSGAYGYIIVDGTQKPIVNDLNANSGNATYHSSNTTLTLTANKKYTIHMEWEQKTSDHIAPRLQYKKKSGNSWGSAQIVPNTCFEDERYVGGGNKAVKFWGYIIPDQTGDYHFGAYSDDGAYGYVIIGNEKKVFVEDWTIAAAYNRKGIKATNTATPVLALEKDKVYPIYMEWYEGCPVEKAFIPRYTLTGKENWKDIPESWFYASSNTEPGDVNEAYFDAYTLENQIPLPNETGSYYVAIQVISQNGTARQVLHGPFKIQSIVPQITSDSISKNFISPEGLSNISYDVYFQEYSTDIKYKVDLTNIKQEKLGNNALMVFDLAKSIVALSVEGEATKILKDKIDCTISNNNDEIMITLSSAFNAKAGSTQTFDIYIPTYMGNAIPYGNMENSYLNQYIANKKTGKIEVTVSATPRIQEAFTKEDGTEVEEQYGSEEMETKEIDLKYVAMPKIS